MSAADCNGTMPAPHTHISIHVSRWFREQFTVYYTGRPQELKAAGLVTAMMENKIMNQRSGCQMDDNHHAFRLVPDGDHVGSKRALWESGQPIRLYYAKVPQERLLSMPGVAALYPMVSLRKMTAMACQCCMRGRGWAAKD